MGVEVVMSLLAGLAWKSAAARQMPWSKVFGRFLLNAGERKREPKSVFSHSKQFSTNRRSVRRQVDTHESDAVPLNDCGLVNALPYRRMQEQPFGAIRRGVSLTDLRLQVCINLINVGAIQRLVPMPSALQDRGELRVN